MDTIKNLPSRQVAWVSREVLDWPTSTGLTLNGRSSWESHSEPRNDANDRLADGASEQARAVAILQLRRAVEFRDKVLRDTYSLDKIPGFPKTSYYKILLDVQVILPIMRKHLIDIRNAISHDDTEKPPDLHRCRELAEFTWYYLKSTDHLLSSPIATLDFDSPDDDLGSCSISVE